jgi:hypothetical protein
MGFPSTGISAMKALQVANERSIPIFIVSKDNISTTVPLLNLDPLLIDEIRIAINSGQEVVVPQRALNINESSIVGYISLDPITGSGAYMISDGDGGAKIFAAVAVGWMMLLVSYATDRPDLRSKVGGLWNEGVEGMSDWYMDYSLSFYELYGPTDLGSGDSCGSGFTGFIPDLPYGVDIRAACDEHDACYAAGATHIEKQTCDTTFGMRVNEMCLVQEEGEYFCTVLGEGYRLGVATFGAEPFFKGYQHLWLMIAN